MKNLLLTILFTIGLGIFMVNAQNVPPDADPSAPPAQTEEDKDPTDPNSSKPEFPVDVVDTTIDDTSEIDEISIDDENKTESKDTVRNNWDNSGMPKKEENK